MVGGIRELLDSSLDAIIVIDDLGEITDWNSAAEHTFGWSRAEAIGQRLADTIVPLRYREAHTRGLARFIETGTGPLVGKRIEIEALHRDGHELPVELTILPRQTESRYRFIGFIRDISARRDGERAIREGARLLERDRARSELLANVSHELRTPLNAILGFSELLIEQAGPSLTERQRHYLANVRDAGVSLLDLVNDVLELSTLESGIQVGPIALEALIGPAVAELRRSAGGKRITLEVGPLPPVDLVLDPRRIRRVIDDLMANAVKYTPEGGSVRFRTEVEDRTLVIEVGDTGIGIPDALHESVFVMFRRLHDGRHQPSGTGLGLHLIKRIVELHGGTISLDSDASGTTFSIRLPDVIRRPDGASA